MKIFDLFHPFNFAHSLLLILKVNFNWTIFVFLILINKPRKYNLFIYLKFNIKIEEKKYIYLFEVLQKHMSNSKHKTKLTVSKIFIFKLFTSLTTGLQVRGAMEEEQYTTRSRESRKSLEFLLRFNWRKCSFKLQDFFFY